MILNIVSWNINFIHDNWMNRIENINKILKNQIKHCHIIALQEATLPFSNTFDDVYTFIKNTNLQLISNTIIERNKLYDSIQYYFPRYKKNIVYLFEYIMNTILYFCTMVFSRYGEFLKQLYFNHPYLCLLLVILCPIVFIGSWLFFGMITIIDKDIKYTLKSKFVNDRLFQYTDFSFNNIDIRFINVHLSPGNEYKNNKKRYEEIKTIVDFSLHKKNVIIVGDFNCKSNSDAYKYCIDNGYKNSFLEIYKEEINTFPCECPEKCIDYIFYRGDDIIVKNSKIFGSIGSSDHKGLKTSFEIKKGVGVEVEVE